MPETIKKPRSSRGSAAGRAKSGKASPAKGNAGKTATARKPAAGGRRKPAASASAKKKSASRSVRLQAGIVPISGASARRAAHKPAARTGRGASAANRKRSAVSENPVARASARRSRDLFLERRASSGASSGRRGGSGSGGDSRTALFGAINAVLLVGIGIMVVLMMRQNALHADFLMMRGVVDQQTFYDGTTVDGVDVSGMTLSEAKEYWRDTIEPAYSGRTVTFDNGASVTARDLGYTSDYEAVLTSAWSAGRRGSLEERYIRAASRQQTPLAYSVTRSDYSENIVAQYVQLAAKQVDRPVQNAGIESFDPDTCEFTFIEARPGTLLDQESLRESIKTAISEGGGAVTIPVIAIPPDATTEEVAARCGMISSAVTNASSSSSARLNNIRLALSFINGTCLRPGEVFSFNNTVGKRTAERGFKKAGAYSSGEVTEQVGGGICQVSTTLFNAVAKADLEIVERHNHSLTVGYVDKGKDATVNWGSQDFRFKNTTGDNIYICCYLTDDKRVRFGIFGQMLENGETITIEAVTTRTLDYDTRYQASALLAPGQTSVIQEGRVGYEAEAYKLRWDANGNQISKELLCKSRYPARSRIIQYGAETPVE